MENIDKILFKNNKLKVIDRDGNTGIMCNHEEVLILPYVTDNNGLPLMLGVLKEKNVFREGGNAISIISGISLDDDTNYFFTAIRELKTQTGYDVDEHDKWNFIGSVNSSKIIDAEYPCFCVDITDIKKGEISEDEKEKLAEFTFIPANDVIKCKDVFIPALFLKLFKFVIGIELYNKDDSTFTKNNKYDINL